VAALALLVVAIALVAAVFVRVTARRLLFPARRAGDASAELAATGAESFWIEAGGTRSEAWLLPARGKRGPAPLLIFTHGNGELIDDWAGEFDDVRGWGVGVLLVEYPGYGRSGGSPSEASIGAAVLAAYDLARERPDVDPARIVAFGRSLGGGAAAVLAQSRPLAALVLESTFTSVRNMAAGFGVPGLLIPDPFDSVSRLEKFRGPVLILHGARDQVVPVSHGKALHVLLPQSELVILGDCGHNDCPRPWPKLREFLLSHGVLGR